MRPNNHVIETYDLWRIYRIDSQEIHALRGINLHIEKGKFVALKGRSGSGKTTLLNCLGGLDHATSGTVRVLDIDLDQMDERQNTRWRREQIGLVFQSFSLMPNLSAYENVELMLRLRKATPKERRERPLECLELVGLSKWMHHRPYELSGGQQQRVAIARSLANHPQLLLADEPTGELDSTSAHEIFSLFQQLVQSEGMTLLMASHDPLVDEYADEVIQIKDGLIESEVPSDPVHI